MGEGFGVALEDFGNPSWDQANTVSLLEGSIDGRAGSVSVERNSEIPSRKQASDIGFLFLFFYLH